MAIYGQAIMAVPPYGYMAINMDKMGVYLKVWKNEKKQSCSELIEIVRKLVDNDFLIFSPPPPTNYVQTHYIMPKVFTQCPPYATVLWFLYDAK